MHLLGQPSWSFESYNPVLLDLALYVRDALRLEVATGPSVPPNLNPGVPDGSTLLPQGARPRAAADWLVWWNGLLADLKPRGPDDPPLTVGGPPDGSPLHRPLDRISAEADEWSQRARAHRLRGRVATSSVEATFPLDVMAAVAADVAFDRSLPIDQVHGLAVCVGAAGSWWHRPRPRVVVCTHEAARDAALLPALMRAVFDPELAL